MKIYKKWIKNQIKVYKIIDKMSNSKTIKQDLKQMKKTLKTIK